MRYLFLSIFLFTLGFGADVKEPDLNTSFVLKKGETAKVRNSDVKIKITGCGHETLANNKGEVPYCDAEVEEKGARQNVRLKDRLILKDYTIVIEKIDLTTKPHASDPWSENSCTMIVRRKRVLTM